VHAEIHGLDTERSYHAVRARPCERLTVSDLAGFTANAPAGSVDAPVGLGPPVPLHRLEESFRRASRALATAAAFGMTGVFELGELGVRPAILADGALRSSPVATSRTPTGGWSPGGLSRRPASTSQPPPPFLLTSRSSAQQVAKRFSLLGRPLSQQDEDSPVSCAFNLTLPAS
jgi:hypothetical protein